MIKIRLIILIIILSFLKTYSQHSFIKHYTMDDGLPSNTISSIFFDSKGYMWAATNKGLARYNGDKFTIFTTYDGLPDNEIFGIVEDYEGRLWINSFKGVFCYYKDNIFHTASNTPWLKTKGIEKMTFIGRYRLQKDSTLLSESVEGNYIMHIKKNTLKVLDIRKLKSLIKGSSRPILSVKLNENRIKILYNEKSYVIDTLVNIIKEIPYPDNLVYGSGNSTHEEYISTSKGFYTPDVKMIAEREIKNFNIYSVRFIYIKDKNNFYISSTYGLLHNKNQTFLENTYLTAVDHDDLGNIWVSSLYNGIFCLSKDHNQISDKIIKDDIITSKQIGDSIFFITEKGNLFTLSGKGNLTSTHLNIGKFLSKNEALNKKNTCITSNGDILIILDYNVLCKKIVDKDFKRIYLDKDFYGMGYPIKHTNSFNSNFYISTRTSLLSISVADFQKSNFNFAKDALIHLSQTDDRIYCNAINATDTSIWFSKTNTMFKIKDRITTEIKELKGITFRQFSFYKNYLVGNTDNNELFIYESTTHSLHKLPNTNWIWEDIYQINDHIAIITTNNYYRLLTLYPSGNNGKPKFDIQIIDNAFIPKQADYIFGNDSMYYFFKNGILSSFPRQLLYSKSIPPKPIFVSFKTENLVYPLSTKINISYKESKTVSISIDNISFSNKDISTEYSISSNEIDNWNTISGNEINLNGLNFGTYTIKIRSKTFGSGFSKAEILILNVDKPFWATWWFILTAVLCVLFLIYIIIRLIIGYRLRKHKKEHEAEMKFQQSEYKALNALMNPHFIFNSLNNIQGLINKNDSETANQYLVIFSKLIRQNMMNISKGFVSLHQELQLVENYLNLEKLRFKNLINFKIWIKEDVDTEDIMISPLLIQPLVENAIIHGLLPMQSEESKIEINVYETGDILHIEILDNGVGIMQSIRNKNVERESYGLTNLNRRIEHLKKIQKNDILFELNEIFDESGKSKGTKATITIKS